MGRARLLADRLAEPLRQSVEPLIDRLVGLRLPRAEHLGHRRHTALHLVLRPQQLRKPCFGDGRCLLPDAGRTAGDIGDAEQHGRRQEA